MIVLVPTSFCKLLLPSSLNLIVIASMLKHPRTPPTSNLALDYQTADSEHMLKRSRPFGISDEVLDTQFELLLFTVEGFDFLEMLYYMQLKTILSYSENAWYFGFWELGVLFNKSGSKWCV